MKLALNKIYFNKFNRNIDWNNPTHYTELIQCEKVYDSIDTLKYKASLTDKYLVRKWIEDRIGRQYLIPLLGVYDNFDSINFAKLPQSFVMKCNHDSGSTTIVEDKNAINMRHLRRKYNNYLSKDYAVNLLEPHYSYINRKIIIEKKIADNIKDFKFICINGIPRIIFVDADRFITHKRNAYTLDWQLIKDFNSEYPAILEDVAKPKNLDKMIEIVKKLSTGFKQVRVDLYDVNNQIYFGEMTFTPASGLTVMNEKYDLLLGNLWKENKNETTKS